MELEHIEFHKTYLNYHSFTWKLPKSARFFLIVCVSGRLELSHVSVEGAYLYNYIEELRSQDYHFQTVIIDFTGLDEDSNDLADLLPEDSNLISMQVGLITKESEMLFSNKSNYQHFLSLEDCLSKFSFENRKLRFDGGKNIVEPTNSKHLDIRVSKFDLEEVSVVAELFKWTKNTRNLYLLKFSGIYPHGSQGANEGKFIARKIRELMRDFSPKGLIIDFSNLNYEWGDDIEVYPWQFKKIENPLQFIFKEEQLPFFKFKLKTDENRISTDFSEACKKLEAMV